MADDNNQPGDGKKNAPKGKKNKKQNEGKGQPIELEGDLPERMGALNVGAPSEPRPGKKGKKQPKKREESTSSGVSTSSDVAAFNEDEKEFEKKSFRSKNSAEHSIAIFEQVTGLSLHENPNDNLCLRPKMQGGRLGGDKPIRLRTNFFKLVLKGKVVYQYDISFLKPDQSEAVKSEKEVGRRFKRITKRLHQDLLRAFISTPEGANLFRNVHYAYDNDRILITPQELPSISREGRIFSFEMSEEGGRPTRYLIRIKPTVRVTLNDSRQSPEANRHVLQIIDIIAKTYAFQHEIVYGSKIFYANPTNRINMFLGRNNDIETPYQIAFGYHQSTQITQRGPMQVIDRATAIMFKGGPLVRAMCQLLNKRNAREIELDRRTMETLEELTCLRVETRYRGYPCTINIKDFTRKSVSQLSFDVDGRQKYVIDYFRETYGINLEFPNLPCIIYGGKNNYIPVEVCALLPNQRNQRKLRDEIIRIVSQHTTRQKPQERSLKSAEIALQISQQLRKQSQFGIELAPAQIEVNSRVLPPPRLKYGNDNFAPHQGDWMMQKLDKKPRMFFNAPRLEKWALISLASRKIDENVAMQFARSLSQTAANLGMVINKPSNPFRNYPLDKLEEFFQTCRGRGLQLIVVIMQESAENYGAVKYYGDQQLAVPTQVVLDKHYDSRPQQRPKLYDMAYQCNLLLKINTKIGGTNLVLAGDTRLKILTNKTMVVGIDVNHPSPGEKTRSIAAVVGSIDDAFMKYRTEIRANTDRDEIVDVATMIKPIIKTFHARRKFYPEHIIVYRDGVSEGQFATVMKNEILPLHHQLATIPGGAPKLTYIIVQKRHNARFSPKDPSNSTATRSGNMLPGSVVDTDVVHYKWFDFYLCSQNSFLGTARPGKYTILWDSSHASADDIQLSTYYLCYLFARATKSIADPAPARYAHHAAARGKVHFREIIKARKWTEEQIHAEINRAINVNEDFKNILYFI